MATAVISRGTTSVDVEIWGEGGDLLIGRDIGNPEARIAPVARVDPRASDHKSATDTITLVGILEGASAYDDARTLAEDLIKPHSDGTALQLDLTAVPGFDTVFDVGVPSARALEVDYRPGVRNRVDVQLTVPVVDNTIG